MTLLSKEPELQYVALRNIILILQKRPTVLQHELKVFFCKYNDPLYVKMEKLEIMIMLVNERNVDQVLMELKEYVVQKSKARCCCLVSSLTNEFCASRDDDRYATAADVEFVRKAVAAIGHTAIKLERAAERCIHVLLELIENGYNPVVQEAMIVIKVHSLTHSHKLGSAQSPPWIVEFSLTLRVVERAIFLASRVRVGYFPQVP